MTYPAERGIGFVKIGIEELSGGIDLLDETEVSLLYNLDLSVFFEGQSGGEGSNHLDAIVISKQTDKGSPKLLKYQALQTPIPNLQMLLTYPDNNSNLQLY